MKTKMNRVAIVGTDPLCVYAVGKTDRGALIDAHRQRITNDEIAGMEYWQCSAAAYNFLRAHGWNSNTISFDGGVITLKREND